MLAIRGDGHYSQYILREKYFCVWPITEADRRQNAWIYKVHELYVNPDRVDRFERSKIRVSVSLHSSCNENTCSQVKAQSGSAAIISTPRAIGAE